MAISLVGHGAVLLWALVSFARPLDLKPLDTMPVDIISTDEFSKITAGAENAPKEEEPKPLVEKIAEAKPVEDINAKVVEKKEVTAAISETAPEPKPKEPDPKPAAAPPEPKTEAKAPEKEKEPEQKVDPIAEAIKKDEAKKKPEKKVDNKPQPVKKPEKQQPKFDPRKVAELLDKRSPQRLAAAGASLSSTASLGAPKGRDATLSMNEIDAIRRRLSNNWNKPAGLANSDIEIDIFIRLRPDGSLAEAPKINSRGSGALYEAVRDSAMRAVLRSAPFNMLNPSRYELWKDLDLTFKAADL
jgi:colicin import membrane protein